MRIEATALPGVMRLTPVRFGDARGWFSETFRRDALAEAGCVADFVQDNQAYSRRAGVVRGLHFQAPPAAQAKLIRVLRGAILDAVVDIRPASPTFGQSAAFELTAEGGEQLLVPEGFAHGYCTLSQDTEVFYKVSAPYAPDREGGLLWCDPALNIPWPVSAADAIVSERDRLWPQWPWFRSPF